MAKYQAFGIHVADSVLYKLLTRNGMMQREVEKDPETHVHFNS